MNASKDDGQEFERASQGKRVGLWTEIVAFIVEYKKWWMFPIAISFLLLAILAALTATGAAPFIYTLF